MYLVLKSKADFCILDEPFLNIAPKYVESMRALIQEEKKHKGIIVSDHLYDAILELSDDLFLLRDGYTFPIKSKEDLVKHGYIAWWFNLSQQHIKTIRPDSKAGPRMLSDYAANTPPR